MPIFWLAFIKFGDSIACLRNGHYGNAIFYENFILGRIVFKNGNVQIVKDYLIKASEAPALRNLLHLAQTLIMVMFPTWMENSTPIYRIREN
jgi:hypothetical protein